MRRSKETPSKRLARVVPAAAMASMLLAVAACGADGGQEGPEGGVETSADESAMRVSFANVTNAADQAVRQGKSVETAADVLGVDLKVYDNDASDEKALENAQLMINDQPDVAVAFHGSVAVNETIGAQFDRAGVPCVAVIIPVPNCSWFRLDNAGLGSATGEVVGEMVAERGWTGEDTTVLLLSAWEAGPDVNQCVTHFYKEVAARVPGMEQVDPAEVNANTTQLGANLYQVGANLTLETAYQAVTRTLPSIPDDRNILLYGVNDDVVLGGLRAIEEAGRGDQTLVAGLGGGPNVKHLRERENWIAHGDVFNDYWGQYVLAMATAIHEGADMPETTLVPVTVLTKENIDEYYDDGADSPRKLPPVAPENEYLLEFDVLQQFGNIEGL